MKANLKFPKCVCRSDDCDIRIQLPNVSAEHVRIDVDKDGKVVTSVFLEPFPFTVD